MNDLHNIPEPVDGRSSTSYRDGDTAHWYALYVFRSTIKSCWNPMTYLSSIQWTKTGICTWMVLLLRSKLRSKIEAETLFQAKGNESHCINLDPQTFPRSPAPSPLALANSQRMHILLIGKPTEISFTDLQCFSFYCIISLRATMIFS